MLNPPPGGLVFNVKKHASNQSWFEDHFLAFYCYFLRDQLVACEKIGEYFRQNFERVLAKKYIPAIGQSLIVLKGSITEAENNRGYELLASLLDKSNYFPHIVWGLWASSIYGQKPEKLITIVQSKINDAFGFMKRESGIPGILAIASMGGGRAQIQEFINKQTKNQTYENLKIKVEDNSFCIESKFIVSANAGNEFLTIFDLCLALIGLCNLKRDKLAYITGLDDINLMKILKRIKRLSTNGGIDLSRAEKNILNNLIVLITSLIVGLIFYYQIGGNFSLNFSNLSISNWSWEEILVTFTLLDYLLGTIQAAHRDGIAVKGLLRLPFIRHFQDYREIRRVKRK